MPDYEAMKTEWPKLKSALTLAKNSKDPEKVLAVVKKAFARFDGQTRTHAGVAPE